MTPAPLPRGLSRLSADSGHVRGGADVVGQVVVAIGEHRTTGQLVLQPHFLAGIGVVSRAELAEIGHGVARAVVAAGVPDVVVRVLRGAHVINQHAVVGRRRPAVGIRIGRVRVEATVRVAAEGTILRPDRIFLAPKL
ncbi:hypothetical protein G6F65_021352 [Rhizopus arrhizus]|nr:hypothetical protein G6F65_021352 [Rhizopus arrhizus]